MKFKTYILNLKKRVDKYNFMKFKLNNVGIDNYEFYFGIDGDNDIKCNKLYYDYLCTVSKDDYVSKNCTYIQRPSVYAIILSYKNLFEKIITDNDENDFVLILEDDVIFHKNFNEYKLYESEDVVYLGGNQLSWNNLYFENKNYELSNNEKSITYGMYAIRYKVSFLKKFYNEYLIEPSKIRKPIDYILWEFIVKNNISNIVIYPNLIIPNLIGSNNMGDRNINLIASFKKWNLKSYRFINLEQRYYNLYNILVDESNKFESLEIDNIGYEELVKIAKGELNYTSRIVN